jgi:hypothetical protein
MNFDNSVGCGHAVKLAHDTGKRGKVGSDVLKHMLHQNEVETVVLKRPWRLLNVDQDVWRTFRKTIGIDKTFTLIEAATEVEFVHLIDLFKVGFEQKFCEESQKFAAPRLDKSGV